MKKKQHTEAQIAFALWQSENGTAASEIMHRMIISEATFYRWKKIFGGMGVAEVHRLKRLEDEYRRLKRLVEDADT